MLIGWALALVAYAQDPAYPPSRPSPLNIVAAEYFIDTDPGFGQGTPLPITPSGNISNANATINVNGLTNGFHRLFIRTRNAEGSWSIATAKEFLYDHSFPYVVAPAAPQSIVAAEYFIDNDPGAGKGTAITLTPGVNISNAPVPVNVQGLSNGAHRLYIRTRNAEGSWSLSLFKEFTVDFDPPYPAVPAPALNLVAAEYFFDTDPGAGKATSIAITPGTNLSNITADVNTSGLSMGTHRLYLRTRNQEGSWSISVFKEFVVSADPAYPAAPPAPLNIVAAEYFIDTDPGAGKGTAVSITPGTNINNVSVNANTNGLALGTHRLYIRTKNQEGSWSLTTVHEFVVSSDPGYPTPPPAPLNVVAAEYFIDTDPGMGKGITIPITPGTDLSNVSAAINTAGLSDAFHRLYIRTRNQEGRWSLTFDSAFYVGTLVPSWTIDPVSGHDFGNVAVNTTSHFDFKIKNTGDAPITLTGVTISNAAFTPTFTAGTVVPARGELTLKVAFKPTIAGAFTGDLTVNTSTPTVTPITTNVRGNGFTLATPPVLKWVNAAPYSGTSGVDPAVGTPGLYTYKVIYQSADNKAPQAGYPRLGIDLNGDQDFDDLGEGIFNMTKEGSSIDYTTGVVYSYSFEQETVNSSMGYQFFATDENGNSGNSNYKQGPVVTFNQPDLRLFANDITFSKNNPVPGESFTVTAQITNSTAHAASDVSVKFYRENTPIDSIRVPVINGNSSVSVTQTLRFDYDGFFPIKVWVDSANQLGDVNILNNYAIRPVTVGTPVLPGGISVTSDYKVQTCPQISTLISGRAVYFGTATPTPVAGAEVTIKIGSLTIKTTTNANGDFSYLLPSTVCGTSYQTYTVSITDFTFTSQLLTKAISIPCTPPVPCYNGQVIMGGAKVVYDRNPCANVNGKDAKLTLNLRYRSSDPNNMWRGNDEIKFDTLKIYKNGVKIYESGIANSASAPGNERIITEYVPLNSTDPVTIKAVMTYTYVEYLQIPSPTYHGRREKITVEDEVTFTPEPDIPDLTVRQFQQTGYTQFSFFDANIKCVDAGSHVVKVYDSIPGGSKTLIHTEQVASLKKGNSIRISVSQPDMQPGKHYLTITTDEDGAVAETDENNNSLQAVIDVPQADLVVKSIKATTTELPKDKWVKFEALIKNEGRKAGRFRAGFTVNGVPTGNSLIIDHLDESAMITLTSETFVMTDNETGCPGTIGVEVDMDNEVAEGNENNNKRSFKLGTDLTGEQTPGRTGTANNPALVRVNKEGQFFPTIRNLGNRDAASVTARYLLNGVRIGGEQFAQVKASELYGAVGSFTHTFTTPGDYLVQIEADTLNDYCEISESNNIGSFHIRVVDTKPDLEVLSQYISPSSINPAAGQVITLVGTVKNTGGKVSQPNVLRFLVDDIQLGTDVPINGLQPGKDTTVSATATYSSLITGVKVMKIITDPANIADEEREDNNVATRTLIVGAAADFAANGAHPISFNPNGFRAGDSVTISYAVINKGSEAGTAWVRFLILDARGAVTGIDSVAIQLAGGASTVAKVKMLFNIEQGSVLAEIVNASTPEADLLNNDTEQSFNTVVALSNPITVNGDLDMKNGLPGQLPGWIGGKLLLGNNDLVVHGQLKNYDATHFVVTNGTGKLKIVNNSNDNVFPVGTSEGSSNFIKIQNRGTADHFSVGVLPYVLKNGTSGDTIRQSYVNRTWLIEEEVTGGSNATLTFYWQNSHEQPLFDRDQARTAHYTNKWDMNDPGIADVDSIGRYRKAQAGFTSFSPFAVASGSAVLPIKLLSFQATLAGNDAQLEWKAERDDQSKEFVVEHSTDGAHFTAIGTVAVAANAGAHTYSFAHASPGNGNHYYRLQLVDLNGHAVYSMIRRVQVSTRENLRVYPNPAQRFISVSGLAANGMVRILTMDGKQLKQWRTDGTVMTADISSLPQGTYLLQFIHQGKQQQQLFIKQ